MEGKNISEILKRIGEIDEEEKFALDQDLNDIIKNKLPNTVNLETIDKEELYLYLYKTAIEGNNVKLFHYLNRNYSTEKKDAILNYYQHKWLTTESFQFIVERESRPFYVTSKLIRSLIKDENTSLLDIFFKTFHFYDTAWVIEFCHFYKHKTPLSTQEIQKRMSNENYQFTIKEDKNVHKYLFSCCEEGKEPLVRYLVEHGMDVNQQAKYYYPNLRRFCTYTPIAVACINGKENILHYLYDHGADIHLGDEETPLHVACEHGHVHVVEWLLEQGADKEINHKNKYNATPLMKACRYGHESVVKCLIERGAKVNQGTPLTEACDNGFITIAKEPIKRSIIKTSIMPHL